MKQKNTKSKSYHSIPLNPESKSGVRVLEMYRKAGDWDMHPLTGNGLRDRALRLQIWARDDNSALKLQQFAQKEGISWTTFKHWTERYPEFREAAEYALMCIGNRRETQSRTLPIIKEFLMLTQYKYDPDYREHHKYHAALKEEQLSLKVPDVIVMEKFPEENT